MSLFWIRGVGFFNDAYDLFVMNVVNVVLEEQFGTAIYNAEMKSAVSASALIGAVIGQLFFGFLGDRMGRRLNMIITCCLLILGGILCTAAYGGRIGDGNGNTTAAVGTIYFLIVARFILGIGIGGEYPLSASATAEDATSVADRNKRVALTFSLQGCGCVFAALAGNLLVQVFANNPRGQNDNTNLEIVWRMLFGIGVIPALAIVYWRFKADEPETYKLAVKRGGGLLGSTRARTMFILRNYGRSLVGTAGTWFLFDIVFYAQNLFASSMLKVIDGNNGENTSSDESSASLQQITVQSVLVGLMALPGYYVAVALINKMGRKWMQIQGFVFMAIIFIILALCWEKIQQNTSLFIVLYGLALFFSNFGPNTSTFVLPTEMFPTAIRGTCHGFSASMGKLGAALGSYLFSPLAKSESFGYQGVFFSFAAICIISIPITWFCIFDNERGLEELDAEFEEKIHLADAFTRDSFAMTYGGSAAGFSTVGTPPSINNTTTTAPTSSMSVSRLSERSLNKSMPGGRTSSISGANNTEKARTFSASCSSPIRGSSSHPAGAVTVTINGSAPVPSARGSIGGQPPQLQHLHPHTTHHA